MVKKITRRCILLLTFLIIFINISNVYANNVGSLKNKKSNINKQMKNTQTKINDIKVQSKTVAEEIDSLDRQMDKASIEIDEAKEEIAKLQVDIESTLKELEVAEEKLKEKDDLFKQRIRVMYMNGNTGYLEILLSSKDVKDFLSRKDMVQSIAEHDKKLLEYIKNQRDEIEQKKTTLEAQRASVEASKAKLESRRKQLEEVSREKSSLMTRLKADTEALEREYDKLNNYAKEIESKILQMQSTGTTYSGGVMQWPLPSSSRITSRFGYRNHPVLKRKKLHTGLDIGARSGSTVVAASSGTVIHSGWLGSYGKTIMIDHGGGIVTLYAHNSSLVVSKGQSVSRGQTISKVGSTGMSTGPHLHFEVRKNGKYVDPLGWVK